MALKDIETEINKKKSQIITEEEAIKVIENKISTLTQEDAEITARAENGAKESDELRDKIVRLQVWFNIRVVRATAGKAGINH